MSSDIAASPDDAKYLAVKARDVRFDGRFFTGVTSTGIYCRPVCAVRAPKRENCLFFTLAAQAESAGFRPCMRCRPELAPSGGNAVPWSNQDASAILVQQAARLLDTPELWCDGAPTIELLAQRLGVSARHVRRIFETHWGISPLQYLQTRRLLAAKQLLTDTQLPVGQIALMSGFSSVRSFNTAFVSHYRMQPRVLRKTTHVNLQGSNAPAIELRAAYRPPYDTNAMLQFFAARSVSGVESVDLQLQTLTRTLALESRGQTYKGWIQIRFDTEKCIAVCSISDSLSDALPTVRALLRGLLDLDADAQAIEQTLGPSFPGTPGLRVPGTVNGFELAVRAILGQQITVQAARTLTNRLVERFGDEASSPFPGLTRFFPTAPMLAQATGDALGQIGIVRQRQNALQALAQSVASGQLDLQPCANVPKTMAALLELPGVGPWTANYIAMRALRWPDAFPAGDVALHKALGVRNAPNPSQAAEAASQAWRPWRSYATLRAWASLAASPLA